MKTDIKTVQLFVTCLVDHFRPEAGWAVVDILEKLGLAVEFPAGQTCCGQPAFNAGFWNDAQAMARHTIDVLSRSEAPVIIPSGSCGAMIIHHYANLLSDNPAYAAKARALAGRSYEFTQFLVDVLGVADLQAKTNRCLTYHPSCHGLRDLNLKNQPRQLLDQVESDAWTDLPDAEACCGFGGLFAVKMGDVSGAILQDKLDNLESTGADTVVGIDVSCLLHIAGGLRRRGRQTQVKHIAEVLNET